MSSSRNHDLPDVGNEILLGLGTATINILLHEMISARLVPNTIIQHAEQAINYVHFIDTGVVSLLVSMKDGTCVEVGLVGREGLIGLPLAFGGAVTGMDAMVQIAGTARRMPVKPFLETMQTSPAFRRAILRYTDWFLLQVAQAAASAALQTIENRVARRIVMLSAHAQGDLLSVTHELMARMLGVQRPGVTLALGKLERQGLVKAKRGFLQVLDRAGLESKGLR